MVSMPSADDAVDSFVASKDCPIAVRDYGGAGPPILLIPGAGRTLVDFAPMAAYLTGNHHVYAMDLRNHGKSGDGTWEWTDVLADVRAVIEHFALSKPVIVGHSLGGMIAALYFERYGDLAAAVNLDGHGQGRTEHYDMDKAEVESLRRRLKSHTEQMLATLGRPQSVEQLEAARAAQVAVARHLDIDPAIATEALQRSLIDNGDGTFTTRPVTARLREMLTRIDELDLLALYRKVPGPLLIYRATRDQQSPDLPDEFTALQAARSRGLARELATLAADHPHVKVQDIDATHALIFEQPKHLARQIQDFVVNASDPNTHLQNSRR
jgi:pimeloyl-ACP methyl ester carboxylesterase